MSKQLNRSGLKLLKPKQSELKSGKKIGQAQTKIFIVAFGRAVPRLQSCRPGLSKALKNLACADL